MALNAGKLLREHLDLTENIKNLTSSEKKLYESVFRNPGISRAEICLKTGLGNSETSRNLFSLAKKSLIHIVNNDNVFPMY